MIITAEFEVERGDEMVTVTVLGHFVRGGDPARHSRALDLTSWCVGDPLEIKLTAEESERAVYALYKEVEES